MANVSFKRGLQANLPSGSNIVDGAFYLTTDTNRLYVGKSNGTSQTLELLNQGVKVYANWATISNLLNTNPELSAEGQIYYAQTENILCTYSNGKWHQINADTNNYQIVTGITVGKVSTSTSETDANVKTLNYPISINLMDYDHDTAIKSSTQKATLSISSADLASITSDASVGIKTKSENNEIVVYTDGVGSNANSNIHLVAEGTATGYIDNNKIVIKSNAASLSAPANSAVLMFEDGTGGSSTSISFTGDDKIVVDKKNEAGKIKYTHATSGVTTGEYLSNKTSNGVKTTIKVPEFTVDNTGHITNAKLGTIELTDSNNTYALDSNISYDNDNHVLTVSMTNKDSNGDSSTGSSATFDGLYFPITIKSNTGTSTSNNKYLQESLGTFYEADTVDELIKKAAADMNAMTYQGVMSNTLFSNSSKKYNTGDTYKASEVITVGSDIFADTGDLLIYKGADETNVMDDWDVVPSGDDIDTQYTLSASSESNGMTLVLTGKADGAGTGSAAGSVTINAESGINAELKNGAFTIKHSNKVLASNNKAALTDHSLSIPTLTYDAQGHITGQEENQITLPDNDTIYTLGADSNAIVLTPGGTTANSATSISLEGDNYVSLTSDNSRVKVAHTTQNGLSTSAIGPAGDASKGYSESFVVPQITVDAAGHVTALEGRQITLPAMQQLTSTSSVKLENKVLNVAYALSGDGVNTNSLSFGITSENLAISDTGSNVYKINLEWDTF